MNSEHMCYTGRNNAKERRWWKMERDRSQEARDQEFETWARDRIKQMRATATAVTQELGLPVDKELTVLRALYGGREAGQSAELQQGTATPALTIPERR